MLWVSGGWKEREDMGGQLWPWLQVYFTSTRSGKLMMQCIDMLVRAKMFLVEQGYLVNELNFTINPQ